MGQCSDWKGCATALRAVQSNSVFGVSSFVDKAINPFGAAGEWVYEMALGLTANEAQLTSPYNGFVSVSATTSPRPRSRV